MFPLFIIPKPIEELTEDERNSDKPVPMLDAHAVKKAPWTVILLLGGGFALASGYSESGLSLCIAQEMGSLKNISYFSVLHCHCNM